MTDLDFEWFSAPGSEDPDGTHLLPRGSAYYARMRFDRAVGAEGVPEGHLAFGETVEVAAEFVRPILLDLGTGTVDLPGLRDRTQLVRLNSSMDTFVSSVALYEIWHRRLLAADDHEDFEEMTARAADLLARLDPAVGPPEEAWWPLKIEDVGRLL